MVTSGIPLMPALTPSTLMLIQIVAAVLSALAVVDPAVLRAHARRFLAALQLADLSVEKAALFMQIDKSLLRRQLDGDGHLSAKRMSLLPPEFFQWWGLLIVEEYGLPAPVKRAAMLQRAMRVRRRMARINPETDRRTA